MKPEEILRIVDAIHRDKNIDKEIVFQAIESALVTALLRHYGEEAEVIIRINRQSGASAGTHDGTNIDPEEITGRIGAQTAKQVIIQKIREAERDSIHDEYEEQVGQMSEQQCYHHACRAQLSPQQPLTWRWPDTHWPV